MNQAIFNQLPEIRPQLFAHLPASHPNNFQQDEVFAINRRPHMVRTLHPKWWQMFLHPLPVGTRVEFRHDVNPDQELTLMGRRVLSPGYQATWQVIATENSFRVVTYIYNLGEVGPQHDMTIEQYNDQFYPIPLPAPQVAASAAFAGLILPISRVERAAQPAQAAQPAYSAEFSALAATFATH